MHAVVNIDNGEIRYFTKEVNDDSKYEEFLKDDPTFHAPVKPIKYTSDDYSKVTIAFNLSNKCNFRCKYCFEDHTKEKEFVDIPKIKKIIEEFVKTHSKKKKVFIDLSGSGEPLLKLKEILEINTYSRKLGEKYGLEVVVQFVTNGYLLSEKIVKLLQDNLILFGVSLDGTKDIHDSNRRTLTLSATYDVITQNLSRIKDNRFVGTAMVLDGEFKGNLLAAYLNMMKYSSTISIKFKRSMLLREFKFNYRQIVSEYFAVTLYLIDRVQHNDYTLLFALLRGDDAFGTMINRVFIENKVYARCDAGTGRYAYGSDGSLYPCSPSSVQPEYSILNQKTPLANDCHTDQCDNCECKYYCGGECPIVKSTLKSNDVYLCEIKRKLFEYALYFKSVIMHNHQSIKLITKFIIDKETN